MRYLTREEIEAWRPDAPLARGETEIARARETMCSLDHGGERQQMGLRWGVACVALEITQRCNLDCTACYLSEHSQAVRDLPMVEIDRRIDAIHARYGANTDVQITGGDPTLRRRDELLAIVGRVRKLGMRPTLMTNGIRASRDLLAALAASGLVDVAFHVDTTQDRKGHHGERSLEPVRERYIDDARAAGLSILFNTTVHAGNIDEIPYLVRYFRGRARDVRTAAFQLQADTGRGTLGERTSRITADSVMAAIRKGAGAPVGFDGTLIGHPACSRYALCLAAGDRLHDLLDDHELIARLLPASTGVVMHRDRPLAAIGSCLRWLIAHPRLLAASAWWLGRKAWGIRHDVLAARGRLSTLSFTVHDFMDACHLERDRIRGCVFKVMTGDGPVSMCLHNAKRDAFILEPVALEQNGTSRSWQPLTGHESISAGAPCRPDPATHPLKHLKGRTRQRVLAQRRAAGDD